MQLSFLAFVWGGKAIFLFIWFILCATLCLLHVLCAIGFGFLFYHVGNTCTDGDIA